jgi:hypothetical protein
MLGALLIALGKRRSELSESGNKAGSSRRTLGVYSVELIDQFIMIIASAAVMTYALYTFSAENLPKNHAMMITVPVVLYGLFRYLFLVHTTSGGEAPEDLLFRDKPLAAAIGMWLLLAVAVLYGLPQFGA